MAEAACCPDMSSHKEDILTLVKELRNTMSGVELMHTLLTNVSTHVAPNIRSINTAADLKSVDLADTVSDVQLICSLITNLTQHMGGKLELFNRKIQAFEEKISQFQKCDTKLTEVTLEHVTLEQPGHDSVNLNDAAASSVLEDSLIIQNCPTTDVLLRSLAIDTEAGETTPSKTLDRPFPGNNCAQKLARNGNIWDGLESDENVLSSMVGGTTPKDTTSEVSALVDGTTLSEDSLDVNVPSSAEGASSSSESKLSRSKNKNSSMRKVNEKKRNMAKTVVPIAKVGPRIASAPTCNGREPSLSYASAVGTAETGTESASEVNMGGQARRNGMLMTRTIRRRNDRQLTNITSPQGREIQSLYPPTSPILLEFPNSRNS